MTDIQLVCFDLGRVLIQLSDGWTGACRTARVTPGVVDIDEPLKQRIAEFVDRSERGQLPLADFARSVGPLLGVEPEDIHRISEAWLAGTFPGTSDLLADLRHAPVQTACLSNTNHHHWQLVCTPDTPNHLPLDLLDHRFASHHLGLRKPEPEIYRHVERETGIPGQHILFFDDREENIAAARDAGWQAHEVPRCDNPIPTLRAIIQQHGIPLALNEAQP